MTVGWILWLASILPQPHADRLCLATTIYLEARSEPFDGQLAIAEVALARLDSQLAALLDGTARLWDARTGESLADIKARWLKSIGYGE